MPIIDQLATVALEMRKQAALAAVIAQREHQANMTVLRKMSDRELRVMGLSRSQIGAGLAEAAKERLQAQRQFSARA